MAFKGALREFDIASVFQFVQGHQQSGRLELKGAEGRWGTFTFSQGEMVLVSSSENTLNRVLLQYILAKGQVDEAAMRSLLTVSRKDLVRLIKTCIDQSYFEEGELAQVLQNGVMDLACELFAWESGTYEFIPTTDEVAIPHPALMINPEFVTLEAMRRLDEFKELATHLKPEMILKVKKDAFGGREIQVEGHSPLKHPAVHLLFLMNGEHTVADLLKKSFLTEFRLYETLFKLLNRGFIESLTYSEAQESAPSEETASNTSNDSKRKFIAQPMFVVFALLLVVITVRLLIVDDIPMLGLHTDPLGKSNAVLKTTIAKIQFEAENGLEAASNSSLSKQGRFLNSRDLSD